MTVLTILFVFLTGSIMLALGIASNQKWLKSLSVIPISLSVFQLLELFSAGF